MFCEKCGEQNPDDANFCKGCGRKLKPRVAKQEKSMILALILSFILTGIGVAYAGNVKKGILLFAVSLIFNVLGFGFSFFRIIAIFIWVFAMYVTYIEVENANGHDNPNILEDFKSWTTNRKIVSLIVIAVILLIAMGGVIGALAPQHNSSDYIDDHSSYSSSKSSSGSSYSSSGSGSGSSYHSSSGSSGSYSSSSNGRDVESHYDGEYGSADTHGTVYDDGSVESHQTGHTAYGDYQIDSYMDSNGNIHGTVDAGGRTYYVNN